MMPDETITVTLKMEVPKLYAWYCMGLAPDDDWTLPAPWYRVLGPLLALIRMEVMSPTTPTLDIEYLRQLVGELPILPEEVYQPPS
jgi:hypothetical protein